METASVTDGMRAAIDFFLHPSQAAGGGIIAVFKIVLGIFAFAIAILVIGIIFVHIRAYEHRKMVEKRDAEKLKKIEAAKKVANPAWKRISDLAASGNESSYRIAIIDADSMLDEMLSKAGVQGDTVMEKLKAAPRRDFQTIDMAFEAHAIRNAIAHSGPEFQISEREARRVIGLFQKVFEEQGLI